MLFQNVIAFKKKQPNQLLKVIFFLVIIKAKNCFASTQIFIYAY